MRHLYPPHRVGWSFEVFPPKTPEAETALYGTCGELRRFDPTFLSITYGAGGSTRELSLQIAKRLIEDLHAPVTAHFTCVGSNVDQIRAWLTQAQQLGVANIMALRGDAPQGETTFRPVEGGFRYANELVQFIRREFPTFGIGVAGYPETHQEAESPQRDLANLKRKVDAGGDVIFTQLFYDNDDFLAFRDRCQAQGITAPIVPGLLPVLSLKQVKRITSLCKACLPDGLLCALDQHAEDPAAQVAVGIEHCTRQVEGLLKAGVPGVHFYVLNRADSVRQILANVGVHPKQP
jgi:methylenetetrahydrofolate reductase (NADPH)